MNKLTVKCILTEEVLGRGLMSRDRQEFVRSLKLIGINYTLDV